MNQERFSITKDRARGTYVVKQYVKGAGYLDMDMEFPGLLAALKYVAAAQGHYSYERQAV